jgi:hypothetical protein
MPKIVARRVSSAFGTGRAAQSSRSPGSSSALDQAAHVVAEFGLGRGVGVEGRIHRRHLVWR